MQYLGWTLQMLIEFRELMINVDGRMAIPPGRHPERPMPSMT